MCMYAYVCPQPSVHVRVEPRKQPQQSFPEYLPPCFFETEALIDSELAQ